MYLVYRPRMFRIFSFHEGSLEGQPEPDTNHDNKSVSECHLIGQKPNCIYFGTNSNVISLFFNSFVNVFIYINGNISYYYMVWTCCSTVDIHLQCFHSFDSTVLMLNQFPSTLIVTFQTN